MDALLAADERAAGRGVRGRRAARPSRRRSRQAVPRAAGEERAGAARAGQGAGRRGQEPPRPRRPPPTRRAAGRAPGRPERRRGRRAARRRGRLRRAGAGRRTCPTTRPVRATTSSWASCSARSTPSAAPRSPAPGSTSSPASARSWSSRWSTSRWPQAVEHGLTPMIAPALVKPEAMEGTGFLGAHAAEVYRLEADDLYLVGTSRGAAGRVPLGRDPRRRRLPRRYAGFSPCFRREAGSYGKDTRGIIRVHQFDKVEMFSFCRPEEAEAEHQRLLGWEKEFLDRAGAAVPGDRHRRRRPRLQRRPQVRLRGLVPVPGALPRADLHLELHDVPGPPAQRPLPRRERQAAGRRDAQRHAVRGHPDHRLPARGAPAAGRLGPGAGRAAARGWAAGRCWSRSA